MHLLYLSEKNVAIQNAQSLSQYDYQQIFFERLQQLSDPVPDEASESHYQKFQSLYGTETNEEFMSKKMKTSKQRVGYPFPAT